jgi:hypothetical protein
MKQESPFLDIRSFTTEEIDSVPHETLVQPSTPFLALYESEDGSLVHPEKAEYLTFLNQLYDEEFEDTLASLVSEATSIYETHFPQEYEGSGSNTYQAERLLNQHFAPLVAEAEALLDNLAREVQQRPLANMSQDEIDTLVDQYHTSSQLAPNFEDFLGGLKNLAKKALSAAATLGLGPVLNKLKGLIKPLIKKVIQTAIHKLPAALQPYARQLADKLPFLKEFEDQDEAEPETTETDAIAEIQYEFNEQVANLLFAENEAEQDLEVARVQNEQPSYDSYSLAELDLAREQFVTKLQELKEGEDPTPEIENFLPALLPALKLGMKLAGRKRVVNFLAGLLGKLIKRFVGPKLTTPLSRAIVDAGLRLIHLEAPQEESKAAASTVAATVEETIRRVAALPDYVLDNQELLEGFALEAFEQAAAANLPPVLPDATYKKHPDLSEARKLNGVWLMMPGGRRKCYKKFSRMLQTRISPHKVAELETSHGDSLQEFLEEQLGIAPGEEVDATVHLYETLPGTRLSDITDHEEQIHKLATHHEDVFLHPLTSEAAALLIGEPELGRDVDESQAETPHNPSVGQRYYYLEVPGKRPLTNPGPAGQAKARRISRTRLILDFPKNEIRIYLFLSELRAQELAVKLRQQAHLGRVTAELHKRIERGIHKAFRGSSRRLKIIHEAVAPGKWAEAFKRLPSIIPQVLKGRLVVWTVKGLADHFKQHTDEFIKAAEDTADGVTLIITLETPPGLAQLSQALKSKTVSPNSLKFSNGEPVFKIKILPGYQHE